MPVIARLLKDKEDTASRVKKTSPRKCSRLATRKSTLSVLKRMHTSFCCSNLPSAGSMCSGLSTTSPLAQGLARRPQHSRYERSCCVGVISLSDLAMVTASRSSLTQLRNGTGSSMSLFTAGPSVALKASSRSWNRMSQDTESITAQCVTIMTSCLPLHF